MLDNFKLNHSNSFQISRRRDFNDPFNPRGKYHAEHWRNGKLLNIYKPSNDITNEGKNKIFNVMFNGDTQIANNSWFIGLVNATSFSAFAAADVMGSHAGWAEFVSYSQTTRVAWGSVTSTAQSVTNTTPATFDFTATGTLHGLFIVTNSTKGGTSGILWSTAAFSADIAVVNGDQLKVTYTVNA